MLQPDLLDEAMQRALTLAKRSPAGDPNPQVGCVMLDPEGRIVAEGWHQGAGTPHAETDALSRVPSAWKDRAKDLTAVVTLEPCNHTGRTGPCSVALAESGIGSVVYGLRDPGTVSGGGAAHLIEAGIEVLGGVRQAEVEAFLAPWFADRAAGTHRAEAESPLAAIRERVATIPPTTSSRPRPRRPRIIVKWAQTLDGRAAAANGTSRWITGPEARADVHKRRAEADAILTGTGTVYADNPALTARDTAGELLVPAAEQPIPVVLGERPIPQHAKIRRHPALAEHELDAPLHLPGRDLEAELSTLARYRIYSVFVEAGPRLINTLLAQGLVDEMLIYIAPALLGGPKASTGNLGITDIADIKRLQVTETVPLGPDLLIRAEWYRGKTFPGPIAGTIRMPKEAS